MSLTTTTDRSTTSTRQVTYTLSAALVGARKTLPLAAGALAFGLVVGVLARQAGLSVLEAALMSGTVFAGASQFIALGLWVSPLPVVAIVLTTLVVNLRHLLMGAAMRPWLSRVPAWKAFASVFFMTDETWAVSMREYSAGERDAGFMIGSGVTMYVSWVGGTVLGELLGGAIPNPAAWGLDFAFTAVFTGLLVGLWRGKSDVFPWAVAGIVALVAHLLLPGTNWYILLGGIAGSLVGAFRDAD